MTAVVPQQRAFVVWWYELDKWMVPAAAIMARRLPKGWTIVRIADLVRQVTDRIEANPQQQYKMAGVKWYGEGVFHRETVRGNEMSAKYVTPLKAGAFIYNRLFAWKASFAVVPDELADCNVSSEFPQFIVDETKLLPAYLHLFCTSSATVRAVLAASTGSSAVSRNRFREELFLEFEIPLPPLDVQRAIVTKWKTTRAEVSDTRRRITEMEDRIEADFLAELGLVKPQREALPKVLSVWWEDLDRWSVMFNQLSNVGADLTSGKYSAVKFQECISETMNGFCIKPVSWTTPHKMLKLNALQTNGLNLTESKFIKISENTAKRFHIRKGDLLISRSTGSFDQIAKCALVEKDHSDILFPDIIIRVQCNDRIEPAFAREVIQSAVGRAWFQQNARTAVGMWKIGGSDITTFPMPLPPLAVQRAIVARIVERRTKVESMKIGIEQKVSQTKTDVDSMILGEKRISS